MVSIVNVRVCEVCEVRRARGREGKWLKERGVAGRKVALMQFVWRYETVAQRRYMGLANSDHSLASVYRRYEARRALSDYSVAVCVCGDLESKGDSLLSRIIHPDRVDLVASVFGDTLSVSNLISMPAGWVMWEKAATVSVSYSSDGHVVLSDSGVSLEKYLAKYVCMQTGSLPSLYQGMTEQTVREGYCYLQLVLPQYRVMAASKCGAYPKWHVVFSTPDSWFDWEKFQTLKVYEDSLCHVNEDSGVPLVSWLVEKFGTALSEHRADMRVGGKVRFAENELVIQPLVPDADWRRSYAKMVYVRHDGDVVLPSNAVGVRSRDDGILYLPKGVYVHCHDAVFGADDVSVLVVVRGAVVFGLSRVEAKCEWSGDPCVAKFVSFKVGVHLKNWYASVLDVSSTQARFIRQADTKVVVLRWPGFMAASNRDVVPREPDRVLLSDPLERFLAIQQSRLEFSKVVPLVRTYVSHYSEFVNLSEFRSDVGYGKLELNGCVSVEREASLTLRGYVSMVAGRDGDTVRPDSVSLHEKIAYDDYSLDGGGPDSDGYMSGLGHDHIQGEYLHFTEHGGQLLSEMTKSQLASVNGFCYVHLLAESNYLTVANRLGWFPNLGDLLRLEAYELDGDDVIDRYKLVKHDVGLHVEPVADGSGADTWARVVVPYNPFESKQLSSLLVKRFADMDVSLKKSELATVDMKVGAACPMTTAEIVGITVSITFNVVAVVVLVGYCVRGRKSKW